jgi:hypothetical protein
VSDYYTPIKPKRGPTAKYKRVEVKISKQMISEIDEMVSAGMVDLDRPNLLREMLGYSWERRFDLVAERGEKSKRITSPKRSIVLGIPHKELAKIDEAVLNQRLATTRAGFVREMLVFAWTHRNEIPVFNTGKKTMEGVTVR